MKKKTNMCQLPGTLERLKMFRSKLSSSKNRKNQNKDSEEDEDGWMNHSLKFVKHWEDSVRTDDYVTIDPLHNSKNVMSSSSSKTKKRRRRSGDRDHRKDGSSEHIPMHLRGR